MKVTNLNTGASFEFDANKAIETTTKTIYVRKGYMNGVLFLSQKNQGAGGAGDICRLDAAEIEVKDNLFNRLQIFADKCQQTA